MHVDWGFCRLNTQLVCWYVSKSSIDNRETKKDVKLGGCFREISFEGVSMPLTISLKSHNHNIFYLYFIRFVEDSLRISCRAAASQE